MYHKGKIIAGLVILGILVTSPLVYNLMSGKASAVPKPEIVTKEKQCVESTSYMRAYHMQLLRDWREKVVRENLQVYEGVGGRKYVMSLTNTCLDCHSNKERFCDQCHNYVGVTPTCWKCHFWKSPKYAWQ